MTAPNVQDITPPVSRVHKITFNHADVPAFLASLDPTAPTGKLATNVSAALDPQKDLILTIIYAP